MVTGLQPRPLPSAVPPTHVAPSPRRPQTWELLRPFSWQHRRLSRLPGPRHRPTALGTTPAARTGSPTSVSTPRPALCPRPARLPRPSSHLRGRPSGTPELPAPLKKTSPTRLGHAELQGAPRFPAGRTPVSCRVHPSFLQGAPRFQQRWDARGSSWNRREPGWGAAPRFSGRNPSCPRPALTLSTWGESGNSRWTDGGTGGRTPKPAGCL